MDDGRSGIWRFPSWMQGKRAPHLWGWRGQWQIIDRVLGRGVGLPPGAGTVRPLLLYHSSGGHLEPSAAAASTLPSQWHLLSPFSLYFFQTLCVYCCQNPHTPAHFAWGKEKLQVYCQHSGVSKHSPCKKVFICICPSYSVLLKNTF